MIGEGVQAKRRVEKVEELGNIGKMEVIPKPGLPIRFLLSCR